MSEQKKINIRNKRATFDYEILEEYVAGIVLVGTEIKSIRAGKASMVDTFCYFDKGELWVRGVNIAEYAWGTCNNHVPRRDRKLLLTARELDKLQRASQDKGLTIVGLRLFLNERGLAKVVVGLARGRKSYDKREYLKENDARREMDKLQRASQDKGLTIVGLRLFLNERGLAKVVVGLARGRKSYDKREYLKENDARREMDKAMKNYR